MRTLTLLLIGLVCAAASPLPLENMPPVVGQPYVTDWQPKAPGGVYRMQLQGKLPYEARADIFVLDLFDTPKETITRYRQQGARVVCYFSAGSYEKWRSDAEHFPAAIIGKDMDGWEGENWLDIRNLDAVMAVMTPRIKLAQQKGCDGVDPDNMNVHTQDSGFDLKPEHTIAFARALAKTAHSLGLKIGLKNNILQAEALAGDFDFAVNESCVRFNQCHYVRPFTELGKPVYAVSYLEDDAQRACRILTLQGFSGGIGNRALDRPTIPCSRL